MVGSQNFSAPAKLKATALILLCTAHIYITPRTLYTLQIHHYMCIPAVSQHEYNMYVALFDHLLIVHQEIN